MLNNKIYWKLVQLGAELQQTPEEYLAMMATAELSPEDKRKKLWEAPRSPRKAPLIPFRYSDP